MQYQLRTPRFTFGNQFKIHDGKGHLQYIAKTRFFSLGTSSVVYTPQGTEVASVRQKGMFGMQYELFVDQTKLGTITRRHSMLRSHFVLSNCYREVLHIVGRLWQGYEFTYHDQPVASVRTRFSFVDGIYDISISKGEKPLPILTSLIGIEIFRRTFCTG